MKKIFTFVVIAAFSGSVAAQVLSLNPSYFDLKVDVASYVDANSTMFNNSNMDRVITWVRQVHHQPAGWYTMVCDDNNCYSPSTGSMNVNLAGFAQGLLKLSIFPNEVPGDAEYTLVAYDATDSINVNASMYIKVSTLNTGIQGTRNEVVAVFPNPARDVLYVNVLNKSVTSVELYSMVGQKLRSIAVDPGNPSISIPVSDLKKGMYFLRVYSNQRELLTRMFSKE